MSPSLRDAMDRREVADVDGFATRLDADERGLGLDAHHTCGADAQAGPAARPRFVAHVVTAPLRRRAINRDRLAGTHSLIGTLIQHHERSRRACLRLVVPQHDTPLVLDVARARRRSRRRRQHGIDEGFEVVAIYHAVARMGDGRDGHITLHVVEADAPGGVDADWRIPERPLREPILYDTPHVVFLSCADALVPAGVDEHLLARTEQDSSALIAAQYPDRRGRQRGRTHRRTRHLETFTRQFRVLTGLRTCGNGPAEHDDDRKHATVHDGDPLALSVACSSSTRLRARSRYSL